jgi:flavin prenyltransferase
MRLVVGITGATGAPPAVRLLECLSQMPDVETHLVMSRWARATIELETPYTARQVEKLAEVVHGPGDQAASISSGSFRTDRPSGSVGLRSRHRGRHRGPQA